MTPRGSQAILHPELTPVSFVHSGDAVVVYTGTSESSHADLGRVRVASSSPPPSYEDFDPDW